MNYTVKQLAEMAGVTRRTLHYYDAIGLLRPAAVAGNGYRHYDETDLLRLQQILFYRELDLSLDDIREILDRPGFDLVNALRAHRRALEDRTMRLDRLLITVDKTIKHLKGEIDMADKELYEGFDEEKQKEYQEEARQRWGSEEVDRSARTWESYTPEQKAAIQASGDAILIGIRDHMADGYESDAVQHLVKAYHAHMGFFYVCSLERFGCLGQMYVDDPRFREMYETKYQPGMAEFLSQAIAYYCAQQ